MGIVTREAEQRPQVGRHKVANAPMSASFSLWIVGLQSYLQVCMSGVMAGRLPFRKELPLAFFRHAQAATDAGRREGRGWRRPS
jgi:hypothetical protein